MGLKADIFEQPDALRRLLDRQLDNVQRVAEALRQRDIEFVFLAARGTSDHAGIYAQYVMGARNQLPVALAAPSLFTLYGGWPKLNRALVIGISQSGQSPDIVQVLAEGRRQGAATLAITNDGQSPLAAASEFTLELHAGKERAVAATKTYTTELTMVALLSAALRGDLEASLPVLRQVPEAVETALELDAEAGRIAAGHSGLHHCVVLGRGFHYGTAREWALKLKELAYVFADPYATADFLHGPIALMQPGVPVLALAPSGAVYEDMLAVLRRLRDDYQAELLVISDRDEALGLAQAALRLPSGLPEWLLPIVAMVPAQLYCYHLTRAKGLDTEAPRNIQKVTKTN